MPLKCPHCATQFKNESGSESVQCPNCGKKLRLRAKVPPVSQPTPSLDLNEIQWMVAREGKTFGPYSINQMRDFLQTSRLVNTDAVWRKGMESWVSITTILPEASAPPAPMPPPEAASRRSIDFPDQKKRDFLAKKIPAALCGIFLGGLGIHKFILGLQKGGTTMLIIWAVCVVTSVILIVPILGSFAIAVIGFVEGILYLTKSDDDFYQTYAIDQKQWF